MINHISNGILKALHNEFGDDHEYYTENVEQGLKEPCFFIQSLGSTSSLVRGQMYKVNSSYSIQFFTDSSQKVMDCNIISSRLFICLRIIDVNTKLDNFKLRGKNIKATIKDNVLTVTLDYVYLLNDVVVKSKMGNMEPNINVY